MFKEIKDALVLNDDGTGSINRVSMNRDFEDPIGGKYDLGVDLTIHVPSGRFYLAITNFSITEAENWGIGGDWGDSANIYIDGVKYPSYMFGEIQRVHYCNVNHHLHEDIMSKILNGDEITIHVPAFDGESRRRVCEVKMQLDLSLGEE